MNVNQFFILFSILFFFSSGYANNYAINYANNVVDSYASDELPRPLPDDSYPSDPNLPNPYPEPQPQPQPPETPYSIGYGETARFSTQTYRFKPRKNLNRFIHISVVGIRNKNDIKNIRIYYSDKSGSIDVYQLKGKISPGEARHAYLDGRPISKVEVVASGSYFWKKSGTFRVDVRAVGGKAARFKEDEN